MLHVSRFRTTHTRWLATLFCITACTQPATRAASSQPPIPVDPADNYYGIYLNGAKVGWMRSQIVVGQTVDFTVSLHASVGGMGTVSQVELSEKRSYGATDGQLESLAFSQSAATGAVHVRGVRHGAVLSLETSAGGATQKQQVEVEESLTDALVVEHLARQPTVGQKASSTRFDPSIQQVLHIEHEVMKVEPRVFGGVTVQAVQIRSTYSGLNISETSWLDNTGKMLESQVGGFFVARLEAPDVARRLDFAQDLLVSAVVKSPRAIAHPDTIQQLRVSVQGFERNPPPTSDRQQVTSQGSTTRLVLTRDHPPHEQWPPTADRSAEIARYLAATPFIQTGAPEIQRAAKKAASGATDVFAVTSRLAAFVFAHVRDEYVPAYSNALEALKTQRGDCTEHSILFVALARALNIPARVAVGVAYWAPGNGFGWHAWAEVYAQGRWYSVDPTWNQPIADATHIKLADGGPAEQARIVMLLGKLQVTEMEIIRPGAPAGNAPVPAGP